MPEPVIPTMTPCVVRSLEPTTTSSLPGSPVCGSIANPRWKEPRSAIAAESMSGPMLDRLLVRPGTPAGLAARDTADRLGLEKAAERRGSTSSRGASTRSSTSSSRRIAESVLLVLQGLDASGKDGVVRRVFRHVNPQG